MLGVEQHRARDSASGDYASGDKGYLRQKDVIGLVEVMKTFHEVHAGVDGSSITFVADDQEPIMAGQVIAEVEG